MLNNQMRINHLSIGFRLIVFVLAGLVAPLIPAKDIELPSLKIGTEVFTNVTVYQMTATDIFMRHARGFGNAKIGTLDEDALRQLGLKSENSKTANVALNAQSAAAVEKVKTALANVDFTLPSDTALKEQLAQIKATPQLLYGILAGLVFGYLLYCLCLQKVCVNAGSKPGLLVWLPILQIFPLLRAAKMPVWWIIVFCVPLLNIFAHLLWCARIARACGKGFFSALMLFLPVTNILALLYLAFSGGGERPMGKAFKNENLPGLAGA